MGVGVYLVIFWGFAPHPDPLPLGERGRLGMAVGPGGRNGCASGWRPGDSHPRGPRAIFGEGKIGGFR